MYGDFDGAHGAPFQGFRVIRISVPRRCLGLSWRCPFGAGKSLPWAWGLRKLQVLLVNVLKAHIRVLKSTAFPTKHTDGASMVHLALTRAGFDDLVSSLGRVPSPLWVNSGVLSEAEVVEFRASGVDLSTFTSDIAHGEPSEFEDALDTIREHHPTHSIWYEYRSNLRSAL